MPDKQGERDHHKRACTIASLILAMFVPLIPPGGNWKYLSYPHFGCRSLKSLHHSPLSLMANRQSFRVRVTLPA